MTELFIQKNQEKKQIALVENGKLIEYYEENSETDRREGDIYIGIVRDIIKGMQSAFIDIGTGKNSFIHLKDILPKIDETKQQHKEIVIISVFGINTIYLLGKLICVDTLAPFLSLLSFLSCFF